MSADRPRLRRRLRKARREGDEVALGPIEEAIAASEAKVAARRAALPAIDYPPELPVSARREEIRAAIERHQVVVVAGETGSGKTTQLPKICLEAGRGVAGLIGHTQPRRIAARSVAARIAEELGSEVGALVGYKVRFSDHTRPEAVIKLMTDGILLAESQGDRFLNAYDTLIIDEAHERSLNIDFLLGYLKQLLPKRPDLKVVITSATIDTERFSRHFGDAPVIEVSGRTHPVELRYRPLEAPEQGEEVRDLTAAIVDAVDELAAEGPGDMLVFLPGEREIRETAEALRKHHPPHTEILPLYARLGAREQNRVFQPHRGRRIVLATNVAETSLTVPGIRYVIDPGLARISRYSPRTKVQRLPVEKISRASADQRAGRCGRIGPGICIRLYSEQDYLARPRFTDPEIRRSNLAAVILRMKSLGLGEVERFPFVEAPEPKMIGDGYKLLEELGAVRDRRLTEIGRRLARLPVDPRLGRMILAARDEGSLAEVLVIAAALGVQDPWERPADKAAAADQAHAPFRDERSDFLAYLKLWRAYHDQKRHLSHNKLRKWCREHFVSFMRMRDWCDVHGQLLALVKEMGWRPNEEEADYGAIHRALLAGLLGNVANRGEEKGAEYTGARGIKLHLFPGSALFKKKPKWIMAAELVETSRLYARTCARIEPEWIEAVAGPLLKRSHFDPHWEKRRGAVVAFERATLYGLLVYGRRRVDFGPIDPATAREIFIRQALVAGEVRNPPPFLRHNLALVEEIEEIEAKARRRDVLVDEEEIFAFYEQRLPEGICDIRAFEKWRKRAEWEAPKKLYLEREALMRRGGVAESQFPTRLAVAGLTLPLSYAFEPGSEADGVTVTVPLPALNLLRPEPFQWLVPGLLHEKIVALIKSLPKALRRNFVPAPDFADACVAALTPSDTPLTEALAHQLLRMTGVRIPSDAWDEARLPDHLRMNFKVVDEAGEVVASGRDLAELQRRLGGEARRSFATEPLWSQEREGITEWDFGTLPESVEFERAGVALKGFPALVDRGDSVALQLLDTPGAAERASRSGLLRLLLLALPEKVKYLRRALPGIDRICLYYAPLGSCEAIKGQLIERAAEIAFIEPLDELPRDRAAFEASLERGRGALVASANELAGRVEAVLAAHHRLAKRLKGNLHPAWLHAVADIRDQLDHLIGPDFVRRTPAAWLGELPRYLKAIERRLEKLEQGGAARDRQLMNEIAPLWSACKTRLEGLDGSIDDPELERYRWMVEELRVSFFAQELGTKMPVSVKRLKEQWKRVARG